MGTLDKVATSWNSRINERESGFDYERVAYFMRADRNRKIAALYLAISILMFVLSVYVFW